MASSSSASSMPDPSRFFANHLNDSVAHAGDVMTDRLECADDLRELLWQRTRLLLKDFEKNAPVHGLNDVSVYTGRAGYAYLYLRLAMLDEANRAAYLDKAWGHLKSCLKRLSGRRISFLCGDPGVLALMAVTANFRGDPDRCAEVCATLTKDADAAADGLKDFPDELLYGRAGMLWSLLFVRKYCQQGCIRDRTVQKVVDTMIASGRKYSKKHHSPYPLMYEWHDSEYLGAAHGLSGILYMLLLAKSFVPEQVLNSEVKDSIDKLAELDQFPSGNFRSSVGSRSDRLVQFCHGAPGVIFLYTKAAEVFPDSAERYLQVSQKCADVTWKAGVLRKGYGLCHGTAGNAYAFFSLSELQSSLGDNDGAAKSLVRGLRFAEWCARDYGRHGCPAPDEPYCLMNGAAGTAVFLAEVAQGRTVFPAFGLESLEE